MTAVVVTGVATDASNNNGDDEGVRPQR
jgi:hypothetical protein